jgi:hypothetical protein
MNRLFHVASDLHARALHQLPWRVEQLDSRGNQRAAILLVLPQKPGERGQTVVRIDGDPARADALLQAARLR